MLALVSEAPISTAPRIREAERQAGLNAERGKAEGEGGIDGGSKEGQNTKAARKRARETDEGVKVFMLVRTGCESELMERRM